MIVALTRLRLTVWRRTPNGMRGLGITVGAALALGVVAIGAGRLGGAESTGDLLALVLAAWLLGWVMGPIQSGGNDFLRPEWLQMTPVRPRRLAVSLLGASSVGIGSAVTMVMLAGLVVYGARLGPEAAVVAVVAMPLVLAVMILASRVVAELLSGAAQSRITMEITALQYGLLVAVGMVGWAAIGTLLDLAGQLGTELGDVLPAPLTVAVRALPPGWAVVAVEAAGRGEWPAAAGALLGIGVLIWLGLLLWGGLLRRRLTGARSGSATRPRRGNRQVLPATVVGAVAGKDLRTWVRDPRRGVEVRSALWAAAFTTAALWLLVPDVLPFAGVAVAVIGAMASVNVYAMDGTALWHTLLTPGAEVADVRGRQLAWLMIFTPATVLPSVVGLAVTQAGWAIPWVAALVPALLGGAAGLIPMLSVYGLVPETDAHKRAGNPAETGGDATGLYFLMLFATVLTAGPAAGLLALSVTTRQSALAWVAVAVGVASGAACTWGFGWLAHRRLRARGPELLYRMRVGPTPATASGGTSDDPTSALPFVQRTLLWACVTVGMIAVFPQALVPAFIKVTEQDTRSWFLALHVASPWQWPVIVGMTAAGSGLLLAAVALYRKARRLHSLE